MIRESREVHKKEGDTRKSEALAAGLTLWPVPSKQARTEGKTTTKKSETVQKGDGVNRNIGGRTHPQLSTAPDKPARAEGVASDRTEPMAGQEATKYKDTVERCSFLGSDRSNIQYAATQRRG